MPVVPTYPAVYIQEVPSGVHTISGVTTASPDATVRRVALFIEQAVFCGTQWVVFAPNDERLWAQIRASLDVFMGNLFRHGALQGKTAAEAYFVRCDKTTTTETDTNAGIVNIIVGFAPLEPAEFVIIKIQQLAGQIAAGPTDSREKGIAQFNLDPYATFRFRVKWEGRYVAGLSKMGPLKHSEAVEWRAGGGASTSRIPHGRSKYDAITLERGVTQDTAFQAWAETSTAGSGAEVAASPAKFRMDLSVDVFNEAGRKLVSYKIHRCWVSAYQVLLDPDANAVIIETITLENEGWERDTKAIEPA